MREFWEAHPGAEQPLRAWFAEAKRARWGNFNAIKDQFPGASILGNRRVVFNAAGNRYRLIVRVHYRYAIVFVRFVGTHAEYDAVNAEEI